MLGPEDGEAPVGLLGQGAALVRQERLEHLEQRLGTLGAAARIRRETGMHQRRDLSGSPCERRKRPGLRLRPQLVERPRLVGWASAADLIDDRAPGIEIAQSRPRRAAEELGSGVEGSSHLQHGAVPCHRVRGAGKRLRLGEAGGDLLQGQGVGFGQRRRDAEVHQLELPGVGEQHVGGFQVAVQNASPVGGGEGTGQLQRDGQHLVQVERQRQEVEAAAVHPLGDDEGPPQHLADAMDRDHVGMLQPGQRARLEQKARAHLRPLGMAHELDGHLPAQEFVVGEEHLAHGAAAQRPDDAKLEEGAGRLEVLAHA